MMLRMVKDGDAGSSELGQRFRFEIPKKTTDQFFADEAQKHAGFSKNRSSRIWNQACFNTLRSTTGEKRCRKRLQSGQSPALSRIHPK
jgi:hypothetical protein